MTPRRPVPEPEDGSTSAHHRTVESYERIARDYADDTAPGPSGVGDFGGDALRRLLGAVPAGGSVLEVGSGPGWDADFLEAHGVAVRRTDITDAFIDLQAERGKVVERLDVTSDDLGGPYDAVLALAVLQHVDRALMPDAARPRRGRPATGRRLPGLRPRGGRRAVGGRRLGQPLLHRAVARARPLRRARGRRLRARVAGLRRGLRGEPVADVPRSDPRLGFPHGRSHGSRHD